MRQNLLSNCRGITQRLCSLVILLLLATTQLSAQKQIKLKGSVVDDEKQPLIGATVIVKSRMVGTTTDATGAFSIEVQKGEEITVSCLGYDDYVQSINNNAKLSVVMKSQSVVLDEVVAIGYGSVRRSDLTGAVSSVSSDALLDSGASTLEDALMGQAAGVMIETSDNSAGAASTIRIRGANSISGSSEPLYVINGVPILNSGDSSSSGGTATELSPIAGIAPQDIESIDILKDASATAIYGAEGANGVIIITTKQGKGNFNVNANLAMGVQSISNNVYDVLNSQEFAAYRQERYYPYPTNLTASSSSTNGAYLDLSNFADTPTTDWLDEITRVGITKNVYVGVSGSDDKIAYNASVGYYNNAGAIENTNLDRYTFNFNLSTSAKRKAQFGVNAIGSYMISDGCVTASNSNSTSLGNSGVLLKALQYNPMVSIKDKTAVEDGDTTTTNPYVSVNDVSLISIFITANINSYLKIKFNDALSFKYSLGGNIKSQENRNYYPSTTSWGNTDNGYSYNRTLSTNNWVTDGVFTYVKKFGRHDINAMAGGTAKKTITYNYAIKSTDFTYDDLGSFDIGSGLDPQSPTSSGTIATLVSGMGRILYTYNKKYSLTATLRADGSSRFSKANRWGYFPSAAFAWRVSDEKFMKKHRWISSVKLRAGFGMTGNQSITNYQSYGLYNINSVVVNGSNITSASQNTIENDDLKWETTAAYNVGVDFAFLKSRINGSLDVYYKHTTDMLLKTVVPASVGVSGSTMYQNVGSMENKGVEFSLNTVNIQKRDFMWKTSFNIYANRNKVLSLGENDMIQVAGANANNMAVLKVGQPVGLWYGWQTDGVWQQEDFTYSFGHADGPKDKYGNALSVGWHLNADHEGNYPAARTTDKPGAWKIADLNNDGNIDDDDRTIIGLSQADFEGSLNNNFKYKNFDLNVMMQFSVGKEVVNGVRWSLIEKNSSAGNKLDLGYWKPTQYAIAYGADGKPMALNTNVVLESGNPTNSMISSVAGDDATNINSSYVEDGSYLRLRSLTLGYRLPSKMVYKFGVKSVRLYVTATNLFTISGYSGYDPSVNSANLNGLRLGYDSSAYPLSRSYTAGVNVSF